MTKRWHYLRPPLPWHGRAERETACGRPVSDDVESPVIPTAMPGFSLATRSFPSPPAGLCRTCWGRQGFLTSWDEDPAQALIEWASGRNADRTARELRRIARMFEAHRDEYEAEVAMDALAAEPEIPRRRR